MTAKNFSSWTIMQKMQFKQSSKVTKHRSGTVLEFTRGIDQALP
nr:hypothetical protein [Limosilactobacillus mucosae]